MRHGTDLENVHTPHRDIWGRTAPALSAQGRGHGIIGTEGLHFGWTMLNLLVKRWPIRYGTGVASRLPRKRTEQARPRRANFSFQFTDTARGAALCDRQDPLLRGLPRSVTYGAQRGTNHHAHPAPRKSGWALRIRAARWDFSTQRPPRSRQSRGAVGTTPRWPTC